MNFILILVVLINIILSVILLLLVKEFNNLTNSYINVRFEMMEGNVKEHVKSIFTKIYKH